MADQAGGSPDGLPFGEDPIADPPAFDDEVARRAQLDRRTQRRRKSAVRPTRQRQQSAIAFPRSRPNGKTRWQIEWRGETYGAGGRWSADELERAIRAHVPWKTLGSAVGIPTICARRLSYVFGVGRAPGGTMDLFGNKENTHAHYVATGDHGDAGHCYCGLLSQSFSLM